MAGGHDTVGEFQGLIVRVTLTAREVVIRGVYERVIPYEDIVDVSGGWLVGPSYVSLSDQDGLLYGLHLESCRTGQERLRVLGAARAAELIRRRAPNLWSEARTDASFGEWCAAILRQNDSR